MARILDLKVGQAVWIKKGVKDPEDFGIYDAAAEECIGQKYEIEKLDQSEGDCQVYAGSWWWPVDWISTTAPKKSKEDSEKPAEAHKTPSVLFTAELDGESAAGHHKTLEALLKSLQEQMFEEHEIAQMKFYEVREIEVEFQPAKLIKKS